MNKQRYHVINTVLPDIWIKNCPVQIDKYQIVRDEKEQKLLFRIRLFNTSDITIHSIYINIRCFDDTKDFIGEMENVAIQGIDAKSHTSFGDQEIIHMTYPNTTHVKISISKVAFLDKSVWKDTGQTLSFHKPDMIKIIKRDPLYQTIERICTKNHVPYKYWFEEDMGMEYWICSCGQINDTDQCVRCETKKEWLKSHFNKDYLSKEAQLFEEIKKKELQEKEKKQQEAKDLEHTIQENRHKNMRKIFLSIITTPVILGVIGIIAVLFLSIVKPDLYTYYKAMYFERTQQNEKAIDIYESLGSYKNSEIRTLSNKYKYVRSHLPLKDSKAMDYLKELKNQSYLESETIYKKVSDWTFDIAITDSESYTTQSALSISAKEKINVYITAHNNNPSDEITLKIVTRLPGCDEKTLTSDTLQDQTCIRQQYWYKDSGKDGKFTCKIYDTETGTLLGIASIPVRK